jgi:hypothetical protein
MHYTRIIDGADDESLFQDMDPGQVVEWDALRLRLQEVPPGLKSPLHPEPMPTMATVLQGWICISASTGDTRRLVPGQTMLFLDTKGKGHSFESAPEKTVLMIVRLSTETARDFTADPIPPKQSKEAS